MKKGETIEIENVKYIAQKETFGCKGCNFDNQCHTNYYNNFNCVENGIILVKIPLELLEKIEQLENQIQQMRNCENCNNSVIEGDYYCCESYIGCKNNSKWEFKK